MSKVGAATLFVKMKAPYILVPPGGKKVAARIAKDFTEFIEGITVGYNETHGTQLSSAEGLVILLNSNIDPESLVQKYRGMAEQARGFVNTNWSQENGFGDGWKWLKGDFAKWFVWNILDKPCKIDDFHEFVGAPMLKKVLIEHPNGEAWMEKFVAAFRGFLYPGH